MRDLVLCILLLLPAVPRLAFSQDGAVPPESKFRTEFRFLPYTDSEGNQRPNPEP